MLSPFRLPLGRFHRGHKSHTEFALYTVGFRKIGESRAVVEDIAYIQKFRLSGKTETSNVFRGARERELRVIWSRVSLQKRVVSPKNRKERLLAMSVFCAASGQTK
jgi:hypothetical protein